jgi:hypothetical protein
MQSTTPRRVVTTVVALIVLCALIVRRAAEPPAPLPASAPAAAFSADRALVHVREIAQRPHPVGSADHARVREYILRQLRALGLDPQVQEATGIATRYPEAGYVRNIIARLPGRTPGGLSVVLMAHYDGVAGGPAAGDDAAGTAAVLETVRALKAGPQLAHDVMLVITDGEEAGLLGAAAFVREHPWAKDVGVTLDFEARGTGGRSYMFETGAGNLDVVRMLRLAGDVSATSLSVTVYRTMPNDTDLSEMALLGKPALNFAFADGVERYHTASDDVVHLDPGSVQHHGSQMLALARAFGDGPLPRPTTGDAVFFDLPFAGLIVYPERWAMPIAVVACVLVALAMFRLIRGQRGWGRDVILGALGTVVATCVAAGVTLGMGTLLVRVHDVMGWGGAPAFRGLYTAALALLALAIALASWAIVRRRASVGGAMVGALIVWSILTITISLRLPGVSFVFAWPLIAGAIAALAVPVHIVEPRRYVGPGLAADALTWVATVIAIAIVVPLVYAISTVLLGASGPGGLATGVFVALLAWLLAPQLEAIGGRRWSASVTALLAAVVLLFIGFATVRRSPAHPVASVIAYALDADSTDAWLGTRGLDARPSESPLRAGQAPPEWLARRFGQGRSVAYTPVSRVSVLPPTATVVSDSTVGAERTVVLRIVAAAQGTETIGIQATDTRVIRASVDGRPIDTSRYRDGVRSWRLQYSAPQPAGMTLALTVPAGSGIALDLLARTPGLPPLQGIQIPPRSPDVVTIQTGDVTLVHRAVRIP